MDIGTVALITLIASLGGYVLMRIQQWRREREAKASLEQTLRLETLRPFQEEITKLQTQSLKETESYKQAKETYDAKYRRNRKPGSKPSDNIPGDGGST